MAEGNGSGAKSFRCVLGEELEEVKRSRLERKLPSNGQDSSSGDGKTVYERARDQNLIGLAFSGGGIRSATFNLGILRGLAKADWLRRFDYLSTVSGGGYIGGWLTTWLRRSTLDKVNDGLGGGPESPEKPEPEPVSYLRSFSNYLTPKTGLLSVDTWTMAAIWLRNVVLNLTILIAALGAVLVVPRLFVLCLAGAGPENVWWFGGAGAVSAAIAGAFIGVNLNKLSQPTTDDTANHEWYIQPLGVQSVIVAPLCVLAWCQLALLVAMGVHWKNWAVWVPAALISCLLVFAAGYFAYRAGGGDTNNMRSPLRRCWDAGTSALSAMVGVAIGWFALSRSFPVIESGALSQLWPKLGFLEPVEAASVWGVPLVILTFTVAATFYIGLMKHRMTTGQREWWARLGGWMLIVSLVWAGLFLLSLGSTKFVVQVLGPWLGGAVASGWIASTLAGVMLGKRGEGEQADSSAWKKIVVSAAPYVFVAGLLVLLAATIDFAGGRIHPGWSDDALSVVVAISSLTIVALFLSWRVDINQFSMHNFYRNRLVRAYIGASDEGRRPHPFTGFDANEHYVRVSDMLVHPKADVKTKTEDRRRFQRPAHFEYKNDKGLPAHEPRYKGPYPIVNATMNLVAGKKLAWQQRKAASFVFTPLYSGFEFRDDDFAPSQENHGLGGLPLKRLITTELDPNGYRPTADYEGGLSLGTAMAISGAAASPNMGYQSSPALAFLMTVFNVRLGWWLGNPRSKHTWAAPGPALGLGYLMKELFGQTTGESGFVYLSDGGHFENLGIYELVRRRCSVIVACDAEQDEKMAFSGLGNAIEKCRTDFGVDIKIDVERIRRTTEDGASDGLHYAVGRICYNSRLKENEHKNEPENLDGDGILIYIKSSVTGDEPVDILRYKAEHEHFPHQTTSDQWFDESQFESYRKLGEHVMDSVVKDIFDKIQVSKMDNQALTEALWQYYRPNGCSETEASRSVRAG